MSKSPTDPSPKTTLMLSPYIFEKVNHRKAMICPIRVTSYLDCRAYFLMRRLSVACPRGATAAKHVQIICGWQTCAATEHLLGRLRRAERNILVDFLAER